MYSPDADLQSWTKNQYHHETKTPTSLFTPGARSLPYLLCHQQAQRLGSRPSRQRDPVHALGGRRLGKGRVVIYGQIAYEAYCEKRGWKSFNGDVLPQWDKQSADLRDAWQAGASAAVAQVEAALSTEKEMHVSARRNLFDLILFLSEKGEPTTYNLDIKIHAENYLEKLRKLRAKISKIEEISAGHSDFTHDGRASAHIQILNIIKE